MYLEHFGLTEPPFRITPHTDFFFSGANRGATLDALLYAATHEEGIIKMSGEVGSGKTMLCRVLMERLPKQAVIVYLSNPSLSRDDILYAIADELGLALPESTRASAVLKLLQTHLINLYAEGRRVVILIDEAHAMPADTLEEIRLLSNLESNRNKLLQLILFGQPELNDVLARSDMRQLKERITHNFALEPLVRDDVAEYLEFRLRAAGYKGPNVFSPAATKLIHDASKGLTRRINILADKSLLAAFAENSYQITAKEVRAAIRDSDFSTATVVSHRRDRLNRIALIVAAGIVISSVVAVALFTQLAPGSNLHGSEVTKTGNVATEKLSATAAAGPAVAAPSTSTSAQPSSPPIASYGADKAANMVAKPVTTLTEQAIDRGRNWLATASDQRWFLQLYAVDATEESKIEEYLHRLGESTETEAIHAYRSDLSGKMRYGIIYGDYEDRSSALKAVGKLPPWVQATRPYPRQVRRLR